MATAWAPAPEGSAVDKSAAVPAASAARRVKRWPTNLVKTVSFPSTGAGGRPGPDTLGGAGRSQVRSGAFAVQQAAERREASLLLVATLEPRPLPNRACRRVTAVCV